MKKPIKIILWVLLGLVLLVVGLLAANPLWLGPVVKSAATSVVPGLTDCELEFKSCSINPYTGKIRLEGVNFKNPKGYDEPTAVSFDSLDVALDMGSLTTKKIHIIDITLEKPFVSYVFDKDGTNNFDRILANVEAKQGAKEKKPKDEKADDKDAPKVLIDRIAINGTKVKYRKVTLPIPVPTLTKIGYGKDDGKKDDKKAEEPQGATWGDACDAVWDSVKDKFTSVGGVVGGAASAVGGAVGDAAGAVGEGAANALKGAANMVGVGKDSKVGETAAKAAEATTGAVKDGAKAAADTAAKAAEATTGAVKDGAKAVGEGLKKLNPFGK